MSSEDVAARTDGEAMRFPSSEELRMVHAIALLALLDAARHGEYRATFRGFRVQAKTWAAADGLPIGCGVRLQIRCGKDLVEQISVRVE